MCRKAKWMHHHLYEKCKITCYIPLNVTVTTQNISTCIFIENNSNKPISKQLKNEVETQNIVNKQYAIKAIRHHAFTSRRLQKNNLSHSENFASKFFVPCHKPNYAVSCQRSMQSVGLTVPRNPIERQLSNAY